MKPETVYEILQTRLKAAKQEGNHTEVSLLIELLAMAEEYKTMKGEAKANDNQTEPR